MSVGAQGLCSMGAAGDGRAPTEELTCIDRWGFCSIGFCSGAAEDGRAPTEERTCIDRWGFCLTGFCSMGAAEDDRAPTEERSGSKLWRLKVSDLRFLAGNLQSEILNLYESSHSHLRNYLRALQRSAHRISQVHRVSLHYRRTLG